MIKIITDSACDISQAQSKKLNIEIIPLKTRFGNEEYLDGVTIDHVEFFNKLTESNDFPTTSLISPYEWQETFKKYKDDEVICITISSKLSGCYQSAVIAASEFENVSVVDSLSAALGQRLVVELAVKLVNEGKSKNEILKILEEKIQKLGLIALLDTIEYLKKGGRISSAEAAIGTFLSIKPVIGVKDGSIITVGKAKGSNNGKKLLIEKYLEEDIDTNMNICFAYSGISTESLDQFMEDNKDLFLNYQDKIQTTSIGAVIGTHVGPGAIGIAYFKK